MKFSTTSHNEGLAERLKDPNYAAGYIKACLKEENTLSMFLSALRDVAQAWGMTKVADRAKVNRQNLYKLFASNGNPESNKLFAIANAVGLNISVEASKRLAIKER